MEHINVKAKYQNEEIVFPLWRVKAWDWCKSLLEDPELYHEFRWDAEQLFRHNGEEFEQFVNEPWTAKRWWEIQVIDLLVPYVLSERRLEH